MPLIEGVLRPMKLLLLPTDVKATGRCCRVVIAPVDLLVVRLGRFGVDWLGCTDEAGVDVPLLTELRVEEDLFRIGPVPLDSELLDSSKDFSILETVFLRRKSLKKGMPRVWEMQQIP